MSGSSPGSFAQLCEQETQIANSLDAMGNPVNTNTSAFSLLVSRHRLVWLLLIGVVFVVLDQGTKRWAQDTLATRVMISDTVLVDGELESRPVFKFDPHREIVVIPSAVSLIYRENPAAAFSLTRSFPDWFRRPFLVIISALASIFFLIWYFRIKESDALLLTSFCLIMAGAVGNLIDRATLGYVIDFLDVHGAFVGFPDFHWPTFNVADSAIVVGALGVLLRTLVKPKSA
jgi:signal peptidase II